MHRRVTTLCASGDATLNIAVTRAQIPVNQCQCQHNMILREMEITHLYHLPPEHAFPALFMQWPKTPSLRHSVNMQHFTSLGSAIARLLARKRQAVCRVLLTIWAIAIRVPAQVFAASASLLTSAWSSLRYGQQDSSMTGMLLFGLHCACKRRQSCGRAIREKTSPLLQKQGQRKR